MDVLGLDLNRTAYYGQVLVTLADTGEEMSTLELRDELNHDNTDRVRNALTAWEEKGCVTVGKDDPEKYDHMPPLTGEITDRGTVIVDRHDLVDKVTPSDNSTQTRLEVLENKVNKLEQENNALKTIMGIPSTDNDLNPMTYNRLLMTGMEQYMLDSAQVDVRDYVPDETSDNVEEIEDAVKQLDN